MARRVVITGLGVVSPVGLGVEAFWQGLMTGKQGVGPVSLFDAGEFPCRIGGQLAADFSARNYVPKDYRKSVKVMARDIEIAVAASGPMRTGEGQTKAGLSLPDCRLRLSSPKPASENSTRVSKGSR